MLPVIVTPATLPPAALAELKQWLGITTTLDDEQLSALLRTALDICADFTGLMPLTCTCTETLPVPWSLMPSPGFPLPTGWSAPVASLVDAGWLRLSTRPVIDVVSVIGLSSRSSDEPFMFDGYQPIIAADGSCIIRLIPLPGPVRCQVTFTAGLAEDWAHLPDPLRHGIMRLAAHQYRMQEGTGAEPLPPASVAALWRPWRRLRVA